MSECAFYDIIKMIVGIWTRFICYYYDGRFYLSECALKVIIKMRACICLNALYKKIMKVRACICLNALFMLLLKWELVFVWTRFIWYYYDGRLYLSECAFKVIIKMRAFMCLNALYMLLLKLELVFVWTRFICY